MRFFARSIGEMNPRFVRAGYVSSLLGPSLQPHPCWLSTVHNGVEYVGPPGTYPVIGNVRWEFGRPVVVGERISVAAWLVGEAVKVTELAGSTVVHDVQVDYLDERGALIATCVTRLFHVDPEAARSVGKYADWNRSRYTGEQLDDIEACYDAETIQGSAPRYLEDVSVGEVLPRIVRGPLTSEEIVLFVGATRPVPSAERFAEMRAAGNVSSFMHPESGLVEHTSASLLDDTAAVFLGFPGAHDMGPDRIAQCATLVTNWMGDLSELRELDVRLDRPHMLGDTAWFEGTVTGVPDQGESERSGTAEIDIVVTNQRSETVASGQAVVELARRRTGGPVGRTSFR